MYGGMETMIPQEVRHLDSLGYDVHVVSAKPKNQSRLSDIEGVHEHHYPESFSRFPWLIKDMLSMIWICVFIRRRLRRTRLLTISFSVTDGAGVALARLLGGNIRMLLRIVGPLSYEVVHFVPEGKLRYEVYSRLFMLLEAFSYMVADRILPVSEFEEANIESYGISKDKVKLVRCGIDSQRFGMVQPTKLSGLPEGRDVVMFVGRFVEKNGPLVIASAVPKVIESHSGSAFVFVGDGVLRPRLETELAEYVSSGAVLFTGYRRDIPELLAQADVYAGHVSSLVEGLGQTVFEAMMSGLPVVVGDDAISRKIITDDVNGILVPKDDPLAVADSVIALLNDPSKREAIGRMARETAVTQLSFESMMTEMLHQV
ncbi:MAG: glycosyltransferase family 4 protein [Methanobacteriota archaeon]|nr:MAG: glycosyltransferase family 4 protein [Euryarchaeota archaeon]